MTVDLGPGQTLIETRWGPIVGFENDLGVSTALMRFGEYATHELAMYHRLLGNGGTVFDVGANIGVLSAALAGLDARRRVVAFEPLRALFATARVNLRRFPNAEVHNLALGAHEGVVEVPELYLDRVGNYGALDLTAAARADRCHPVVATTIDAFVSRRGVVPDLVKIDVEGMEPLVIEGAAATLCRAAPMLSVEVDRRAPGARAVDLLVAAGYRVFLAFFRAVPKENPRFDPDDRHCRTMHMHVIGLPAAVPDWWILQDNELRGGAEFLARFDRRFPPKSVPYAL